MSKLHEIILPKFREMVDSDVRICDSVSGHSGQIALMLVNPTMNYHYSLQHKNDWFGAFARICQVPNGGIGQSFSSSVVVSSLNLSEGCWIVVAMLTNQNVWKFYGILARNVLKWVDEHPKCIRNVNGEITPNYSVPVKLMMSMEGFNK